jgi:hypothetical protein
MKETQISSQIKNLLASLAQLESDISKGNHLLFQKDKLKNIAIQLHLLADQIGIEEPVVEAPVVTIPVAEINATETSQIPKVAKLVELVKEVEPVKEIIPEPIPEPTPEPIPEPTPEPTPEPVEEVAVPVAKVEVPEIIVEVPKTVVEVVEEKQEVKSEVKLEEKKEPIETIVAKPIETKKETIVESVSVNDKLSKSAVPPQNIAEKLKETPIPDLVKAIAISKKFEFINLLFDGNAEYYKQCIQTVQSSSDYQTAIQYIEQDVLVKFDWQEHEKLAAEFFSLVRRRFL